MGFFDGWDSASVITRKPHSSRHHSSSHKRRSKSSGLRPKSRSRSRSRSPAARAFFAGDEDSNNNKPRYSRHNSSRTSVFGLPNVSSRSFFGSDKHRASTSSYRRSPRPNFLARAYKQLKRLLRDLVYYAKRHPVKVFTLVILPLITGGALTALLARFGLRMPPSIERMLGFGARAMSGDAAGLVGEAVRMAGGMGGDGRVSLERGREGGLQWERRSYEREFGGGGGGGGGGGWMDTVRDWF